MAVKKNLKPLFIHFIQFLVILIQSKQDREPLFALVLDCLCRTGIPPWSFSFPFHRTILLFLLFCKIMFPGPVGALLYILHCTLHLLH